MPKNNESIGAILGVITALATAAFLLCFRAAATHADRNTIVFALLLWSALFNSVIMLARIQRTPWPDLRWVKSALFLGSMTLIGNVALAGALPLLGAGVMSTMMQLQVFFVALGAWVFLRERVAMGLIFGALLAAGGFALFALPGEFQAQLSFSGLVGGLVTGLCFAAMMVWTRAVIANLDPVSLNAGRLWLAAFVMALWPGTISSAQSMPTQGWLLTAAAALGGPVLGRLAIMYSLRYISAAKTKLWGMLSPVFAFLLVFLIYGERPGSREVLGGILIVAGVLIPTAAGLRGARRR